MHADETGAHSKGATSPAPDSAGPSASNVDSLMATENNWALEASREAGIQAASTGGGDGARDRMSRCLRRPGGCLLVPKGVSYKALNSGREYSGRLLLLLPVHAPLRRKAIELIESPWFDRVVLVLILANCVVMALQDPLAPVPAWSSQVDWLFAGLFTAELMMKGTAMGFTPFESPRSYLSEGWNVLDALIVLIS